MEADKVTEKKATKLPALIYCLALCGTSGFMFGAALKSPLLGVGISLGLLAVVSAIFFSQDWL